MSHLVPYLPGNIGGVTTPCTAEQLNASSFWKKPNPSDLITQPTANFATYNNDAQLLFYTSGGAYRWSSTQSLPSDGALVINSSTLGQYILSLSNGDMAGVYLAGDIQETLPVVVANLNFASMTAQSQAPALTATVPGARVGDFVQLDTPDLGEGVIVARAWVSAKNTVSIRVFNADNVTRDPGAADFAILVTTRDVSPVIFLRGHQFFSDLQDTVNYTNVQLQADLASEENKAHFERLLASRRRRQLLLNNSAIKTHIQNSARADEIMKRFEGASY